MSRNPGSGAGGAATAGTRIRSGLPACSPCFYWGAVCPGKGGAPARGSGSSALGLFPGPAFLPEGRPQPVEDRACSWLRICSRTQNPEIS